MVQKILALRQEEATIETDFGYQPLTFRKDPAVDTGSEGKRMASGLTGNEVPLSGVAGSSPVPSAFLPVLV